MVNTNNTIRIKFDAPIYLEIGGKMVQVGTVKFDREVDVEYVMPHIQSEEVSGVSVSEDI